MKKENPEMKINQWKTKKAPLKTKSHTDTPKPISDTAQVEKIDSGSETSLSEAGKRVNLWSSIQERAKDFPQSYRGHYLRAMQGKSRQAAIRANCIMCMGYTPSEVQKCTCTACPLFLYRMRG